MFKSALTVVFSPEQLLSILPYYKLNGPGFILLEKPPADFREWGIKPGDPVSLEAEFIRLPGRNICLSPAAIWVPSPPACLGLCNDFDEIVLRLLPPESRELTEKAVGRRAQALVRYLVDNQDCPDLILRPLVGAGPGLTPAGDDFIVGFLAGCLAGEKKTRFKAVSKSLASIFNHQPQATTLVSRHFLSWGTRGVFCEFFLRFIQAAAAGEHDEIVEAACLVLSFGASSGVWLLRGFLAAGKIEGRPKGRLKAEG